MSTSLVQITPLPADAPNETVQTGFDTLDVFLDSLHPMAQSNVFNSGINKLVAHMSENNTKIVKIKIETFFKKTPEGERMCHDFTIEAE